MDFTRLLRVFTLFSVVSAAIFAVLARPALGTPLLISPANVNTLNTGYGMDGVTVGTADPNWNVSLISPSSPPPSPNQGFTAGPAYLVPDSFTGLNGTVPEWEANYTTTPGFSNGQSSSWITYASPTPSSVDNTDDTYQYQLVFQAASNGAVAINFLSDNSGTLYVNNVEMASNADNPELGNSGVPNTDGLWLSSPVQLAVLQGGTYTIDLDVNNAPNGPGMNPTGARVEFAGTAALGGADPVPDQGATAVLLGAGVLAVAGVRQLMRPGKA
jgi:hypothetical protein